MFRCHDISLDTPTPQERRTHKYNACDHVRNWCKLDLPAKDRRTLFYDADSNHKPYLSCVSCWVVRLEYP